MLKKIMAIVLTVVICMFDIIGLKASEQSEKRFTDKQKNQIITALQYVEENKSAFNLENVDFSMLFISNAVSVYEYKANGFSKIGEVLPILYQGEIVAIALETNDGYYCIETALAKSIQKNNSNDTALIYDSHAVYLFDGSNIIFLAESGVVVSERDSLPDDRQDIDLTELNTSKIKSMVYIDLPKKEAEITRTQSYYSCNVSFVPQSPYSDLCWAATVATINNFVHGTSLSAGTVSKAYFNTNTVINSGVYAGNVAVFMREEYGLNYTFNDFVPSENVILTNIKEGHPVYGSFDWSSSGNSGRHAGTIYGINPISGYISVMDPESGSTTASSTGVTYTYVSSTSYVTMTLGRAICYSW